MGFLFTLFGRLVCICSAEGNCFRVPILDLSCNHLFWNLSFSENRFRDCSKLILLWFVSKLLYIL